MKMKKIFILGGLLLSGALVSGCSDFLEVKKYGASTVWETQGDIDKAIAALYSFTTNDSEGVTGRGIMWFECCSDNLTVGRPQSEAEDIRNFRMAPSNGRDVKNNWKIMYEVNAKANNIIKMVPTMNLDEAYKRKATGIAYFFRGFAMLWIAPYYGDNGPNGGIPIILDTTEPADMDIPRPASVLQNYDQIIRDLREAGERLPYFSELAPEEYGLPHKAAAWAFAARAALYAAQFDAKYYDTVIEMCDKVMALSGADKRDLFDDGTDNTFANLWRKEQNFGCEYIFSLLGNASDGPKFHGMSFQNGGWGLYNHWGYFQPTLSLWEAFEEGDIRRDATILYPGQTIKFMGREILFGSSTYGISSDTGMTFRKFLSPWEEADCVGKDVNPNGDNASNTLGMCLMRYADVLVPTSESAGKVVRIACAHFDHMGYSEVRTRQARESVEFLGLDNPEYPTIMMGDLNVGAGSVLDPLSNVGDHIGYSWVDHIWAFPKGAWSGSETFESKDCGNLSDHDPVMATVTLK